MEVRILSAALLALVLAAAAPVSAQARSRAPRTCNARHTKTVAADARIRVFQVRRVVEHAHVHYGCLLRRNRPVRFYLPDFPTGYGPIALAAPFVAYGADSDCAASFCDPNSVVVQNLRSGRTAFVDGPDIRIATVYALVLKPNGSAAWIASTFDITGQVTPGVQVAEAEAGQRAQVLDQGGDIAPDSLALAGSTLYWTKAGVARSAELR